jgi:stress response protein YsnF
VSPADLGGDAFRERTVEVTGRAEEAVVSKDTRVREEIVVWKPEERTQTLCDTVRRTEVELEDERAPGATCATMPKP